jgi:hypothetical protein
MSEQFKEWIQATPLYEAMINAGYFPVWGCSDDDEWSITYWSIRDVPLTYYERVGNRVVRKEIVPQTDHVIRVPYEDCDLHMALMNTGYSMYRENYYHNGLYTGLVVDCYAPTIDYSSYRYESSIATLYRLRELDRRLGTDFVGDLKRDLKGFGGDPLYDYFYGRG